MCNTCENIITGILNCQAIFPFFPLYRAFTQKAFLILLGFFPFDPPKNHAYLSYSKSGTLSNKTPRITIYDLPIKSAFDGLMIQKHALVVYKCAVLE